MMGEEKVLVWVCWCGKRITSIYPEQLDANKKSHMLTHKDSEVKPDGTV